MNEKDVKFIAAVTTTIALLALPIFLINKTNNISFAYLYIVCMPLAAYFLIVKASEYI